MEFDITLEDLQEIGFNLPGDPTTALAELNDELNKRIGTEITESLDDEQLEQMMLIKQSGDENALTDWMVANIPELKDIVSDERDILLGELADKAEESQYLK